MNINHKQQPVRVAQDINPAIARATQAPVQPTRILRAPKITNQVMLSHDTFKTRAQITPSSPFQLLESSNKLLHESKFPYKSITIDEFRKLGPNEVTLYSDGIYRMTVTTKGVIQYRPIYILVS